jgi:hypothetical protein
MEWERVEPYRWRQEPQSPGWRVFIEGVKGTVQVDEIVWITGRFDLIDQLYWDAQSVLDGHYHCCLWGKCWILR